MDVCHQSLQTDPNGDSKQRFSNLFIANLQIEGGKEGRKEGSEGGREGGRKE